MRKIVVYHKGGSRSVYKFPRGSRWADHWMMYKRECEDGLYVSCELWCKSNAYATALPGEEVWDLIERFTIED